MPRNSSHLVEAQSNSIRRLMEENKTRPDNYTNIEYKSRYPLWYKRRIQKQVTNIWEKVHVDSAKYMAAQLVQSLELCYLFNKK